MRAGRDDDDMARIDLSAGDHPIVIRLHQRTGRWDLRVRLLDERDLLPPDSVSLVLPGAGSGNGAELAASMASVDVELQTLADRYVPALRVQFAGGVPANAPLAVRVSAWVVRSKAATRTRLYDAALGDVPRTPRSVIDLRAQLPPVIASEFGEAEDDASLEFEVELAGKTTRIARPVRASVRRALGRIDKVLSRFEQLTQAMIDRDVVRATLQHDRDRLEQFISSGDKDPAATVEEAGAIERFHRSPRGRPGSDRHRARSDPARLRFTSRWSHAPVRRLRSSFLRLGSRSQVADGGRAARPQRQADADDPVVLWRRRPGA